LCQHKQLFFLFIEQGINKGLTVGHYAITRTQAEQLEMTQKQAIHIIYPFTLGMPYRNILFDAELSS